MTRGIRQGCPISALLFVLEVEILAIMIRNSDDVLGIKLNNIEHKIVQYTDGATIILNDIQSIEQAFALINHFSLHAGPTLNIKKTKGFV